MSRRSYSAVIKSFHHEVDDAFRSVAVMLALNGPERDDSVMQTATYGRDGLRYCIGLDTAEMTVLTSIEVELDRSQLVAGLDQLVVAAGLGAANSVHHSARTVHDLRHTLRTQAELIEKIHPTLLRTRESDTTESVFRGAGAREWNR